jgi:hypothetical protein
VQVLQSITDIFSFSHYGDGVQHATASGIVRNPRNAGHQVVGAFLAPIWAASRAPAVATYLNAQVATQGMDSMKEIVTD